MDFGRKIREYRLENNIRQSDFLKKANICQQHLSRIELGKTKDPSYEVMNNIGRAMDISPAYLFFNEGKELKYDDSSRQVYTFNKIKMHIYESNMNLARIKEQLPSGGIKLTNFSARKPPHSCVRRNCVILWLISIYFINIYFYKYLFVI